MLYSCSCHISYGENLQANQMSHIVTLWKTEINPWPLPLSMSLLVLVFVCICFYLSLFLSVFVFICLCFYLSLFLFVFVFICLCLCETCLSEQLGGIVAISQAAHGNEADDPWKSTRGPRWLPTFLLRLPHDCPPLTKTTHRNYHSTLSVQIIRSPNYPHLPPKLSLISASLVNSHILQHFPARSIFAQDPNKHKIRAGSIKKSNNGSMCGNRRGSGEEAEPQKLRAIDTAQCLSWSGVHYFRTEYCTQIAPNPHRRVRTN